MKTAIKYFVAATLILFIGTEVSAQEKNKKKKQDSTYLQNKQRADEQRERETEDKRRNDSLKLANHRDSLANVRRDDSLRFDRTRRDSLHNMEMQRRQDSIDKSQPPKKGKDKTTPPKNQGTKPE